MNSVQNNFMKPHPSPNFLLSNPSYTDRPSSTQIVQNNPVSSVNDKKIEEVWSKHNFDTNKVKVESIVSLGNVKTTWGANAMNDFTINAPKVFENDSVNNQNVDKNSNLFTDSVKVMKTTEEVTQNAEQTNQEHDEVSPSHHARRPPNAFLIFCKKHRPIVRQRYPTTENRGVTKILGEWWALMNAGEKQPYNDLAKEYKDAFLSANPNFRWYKLPAPPLRTLTTRPTTIPKPPVTISSPPPSFLSEFTPGKLADESQLGGLTSLMNNNYSPLKKMEDGMPCCKIEDNNNEKLDTDLCHDAELSDKMLNMFSSPTNLIKPTLPPKPIKKRIFEQYEDEKNCSVNLFNETNGEITQQDLLNKVVDGIFANEKDEPKEQRKSDRMCKGKRYERFMVEGKLLGNKRDTKLTQHHRVSRIESKIEHELTNTKLHDPPRLPDLEYTIKRLAERTNKKIDLDCEDAKPKERARTVSETTDSSPVKSSNVNFNLDLRIDNLTSLSYDDFIKRKRENKKRKQKIKTDHSESKSKMARIEVDSKVESPPVVGSKKRKNKQSITHLNQADDGEGSELGGDNALLGLATLAMVAANTEKIGDNGGD